MRSTLFALQQAALAVPEDDLLIAQWSEMLSIAQRVAAWLIVELRSVARDTAFWKDKSRVTSLEKRFFMLLSRGPIMFASTVLGRYAHRCSSALPRIGGVGASSAHCCAGASDGRRLAVTLGALGRLARSLGFSKWKSKLSAHDAIQERLLSLRAEKDKLAGALANVYVVRISRLGIRVSRG